MRIRKSHICLTIATVFVLFGFAVIYHRYKAIDAQFARTIRINHHVLQAEPLLHQKDDDDVPPVSAHPSRLTKHSGADGSSSSAHPLSSSQQQPDIVLAVVTCGMRLQETLNMIKSVLIFNVNRRPLRFMVITENELITSFQEKLSDWQALTANMFKFEIMPLSFPSQNTDEWRNLFKPCASQRLFLPAVLKDIDSVLYVDTDTLFLSPIERIWSQFEHFNASQMAALSPEHEDKNVGWYNRFARHPFYGPLGVNSGVMLMNLTRMREFKWTEYIQPLYAEYKLKITWGDQDLINILFHFHSDKLYVFPCEWNYRPDHCMYMAVCKAPHGVQILHGNRGYFHAGLQPAFSATYRVVEQYRLGSDAYRNVLLPLEAALADESVAQTNCGHTVDRMLVVPREVLKETEYFYNEIQ